MNIIILLSIALVLCAYFWPACPKILKENKQILLGVIVGLVLCSFYNLKVEGLDPDQSDTSSSTETQIIKRDPPVSGCGEKIGDTWSNCEPDINTCINNECVSNSEFTRLCNIAKRGANSSHESSHALLKGFDLTPETMGIDSVKKDLGITDNSQHGHYHAYHDECTNPTDCKGESAFTNNTGRWCVNGGCMTTSDFSRLTCRN